jgi:hypothetical protein
MLNIVQFAQAIAIADIISDKLQNDSRYLAEYILEAAKEAGYYIWTQSMEVAESAVKLSIPVLKYVPENECDAACIYKIQAAFVINCIKQLDEMKTAERKARQEPDFMYFI